VIDFAHFHEIADRREAGEADGFETLNLVAERAGKLTVDVEWAAAHAGDGAHFLDARIGEFADDEGLPGTERVLKNAGDLDDERLDLLTLENGPDLTALAGFDFGERESRSVGRLSAERSGEQDE
jgi:hypothetical protein